MYDHDCNDGYSSRIRRTDTLKDRLTHNYMQFVTTNVSELHIYVHLYTSMNLYRPPHFAEGVNFCDPDIARGDSPHTLDT